MQSPVASPTLKWLAPAELKKEDAALWKNLLRNHDKQAAAAGLEGLPAVEKVINLWRALLKRDDAWVALLTREQAACGFAVVFDHRLDEKLAAGHHLIRIAASTVTEPKLQRFLLHAIQMSFSESTYYGLIPANEKEQRRFYAGLGCTFIKPYAQIHPDQDAPEWIGVLYPGITGKKLKRCLILRGEQAPEDALYNLHQFFYADDVALETRNASEVHLEQYLQEEKEAGRKKLIIWFVGKMHIFKGKQGIPTKNGFLSAAQIQRLCTNNDFDLSVVVIDSPYDEGAFARYRTPAFTGPEGLWRARGHLRIEHGPAPLLRSGEKELTLTHGESKGKLLTQMFLPDFPATSTWLGTLGKLTTLFNAKMKRWAEGY